MEYIKVKSVKEIGKIKKNNPVYFLAGSTDFMIMYKENMIPENSIIFDISKLPLNYIKMQNNKVVIGALTTFSEIADNKTLKKYFPALIEAASSIGSPQIRNRATIGGNIGNGSPAGDSIPALFVYNAKIKTTKKTYKAEEFFKGVKKTVLENGELIKEIELPVLKGKYNSYFFKSGAREALAISKASLACLISVKNKIITDIRLAAGAVGVTVVKCNKTEEFLMNRTIDDNVISSAQDIIKEDIAPITDFRSTKEYRENIISYYLKQALKSAIR